MARAIDATAHSPSEAPKPKIVYPVADVSMGGCMETYYLSSEGQTVLAVRKRLLSWGDTYEIEIADGGDTDKLIAFVIMIDSIYHRKGSQ